MTEVQKLNESPLSKAILNLLPNPQRNSLYLLQWLRQTLLTAEGLNQETGLTPEEAANLEMLTYSEPSEARNLYRMLAPVSGEPWSSSDLIRKSQEAEKQLNKAKDYDLTPAQLELLQMFTDNLNNNGADLSPSLHAEDR